MSRSDYAVIKNLHPERSGPTFRAASQGLAPSVPSLRSAMRVLLPVTATTGILQQAAFFVNSFSALRFEAEGGVFCLRQGYKLKMVLLGKGLRRTARHTEHGDVHATREGVVIKLRFRSRYDQRRQQPAV